MKHTETTKENLLNRIYGYSTFKARQADIIDNVTDGSDVLVIMPTGGGKSLTYQIPSLLRDGVGVVISPLIALMKDQVDALREIGITAGFLNSTQTDDERYAMEARIRAGEIELLYVAPERLKTDSFKGLLRQIRPALFAIDEAHCVSQWGHDFRPDYLTIERALRPFKAVPRMALTATADRTTREDIVKRLDLRDPKKYIDSFDRPNIQYRIQPRPQYVKSKLLKFIREEFPDESGIIYVGTRNMTEDYALFLQDKGIKAVPYHAGMKREERTENQDLFTRGEIDVVVATIAFGMGIDKPDIRYVVHIGLPSTIEAYYQETGRAGRDGLPAVAWMMYSMQDVIRQQGFIDRSDAEDTFKQIMTIKLNRLLGLCESVECRRRGLLAYFDEEMGQDCGNCDNCKKPPERWDGTIPAKKALSAVYRTKQTFGSSYIIDLLRGRKTERILENEHHKLPTFGCGTDVKEKRWRSVMRQLLINGYLLSDPEMRGGLRISEKGMLTMTDEDAEVRFRKDVDPAAEGGGRKEKALDHMVLDQGEDSLYEKLKTLRKELAEKRGVPAYMIFHDKTLALIARAKPTNWAELQSISGVGQYKVKQYGDAFCDVVRKYTGAGNQADDEDQPSGDRDWLARPEEEKPRRVGARWTVQEEDQLRRLQSENRDVKEIARILQRKPGAVYNRMAKLGIADD